MDWRLIEYAKKAEDTASGLHVFKDEIPQYAKDITAGIAELFAISSALRTLHDELDFTRYGKYIGRIIKDLELVLPTLSYTLDDVRDMFKKSKRDKLPGAFPGTPPYHLIWEDSCADLKAEGMPLPARLEFYRVYLQDMNDVLQGQQQDQDVYHRIRPRLSKLLKIQIPNHAIQQQKKSALPPPPPPPPQRHAPIDMDMYFQSLPPRTSPPQKHAPIDLDLHFHGLNVGDPRIYAGPARTPRPKSPAISRPKVPKYPTYPAPAPMHEQFAIPKYTNHPAPYPMQEQFAIPAPPPPPPPPLPPRSPYVEMPYVPPPVPEVVPQSPTYSTASSQTFSTHSNDSGGPAPHWGMKIFDGRHSSTPFQTLGQPTRCLGKDEPQSLELLEKDGFMRIMELPFEATNVLIRLYWKPENSRARILFLTKEPNGSRLRYCVPLTNLKVIRTESCLQLCRVNRYDGELDLWANLRFLLYERMVLFFCVLVALKRQDEKHSELEDFFQPGEKEEFGGEIKDSEYLHAFRIFRDRDSGGVRFEVKPRRGPNKLVPIWTAFVTQYIGQRNWMKQIGNTTVQFRELRPYVFCEGYKPPRGQSGRYTLTFTSPEDTRHFMETFHRIRTR